MAIKIPLFTSYAGITHTLNCDMDGSILGVESKADVQDILDGNHEMAAHNDGYSPDKFQRRAARIPLILIQKWKNEEGFDALNPDHQDAVDKKLNSIEYHKLRTAPGRL